MRWKKIDPANVNNIGLGKSIYMKKQLEEFTAFQDSQGTRKAYLAETAELAYMERNEKGEWGLALGAQAQLFLVNLVGMIFFPLYGPLDLLPVPSADGLGWSLADHDNIPEGNHHCEIQRLCCVGTGGFLGHIISVCCLTLQLD
jgi:hypothetical protein